MKAELDNKSKIIKAAPKVVPKPGKIIGAPDMAKKKRDSKAAEKALDKEDKEDLLA